MFVHIIAEVFSLIRISKDRTRTYCHPSAEQRALVGPETFQDERLLNYFPGVNWLDDPKSWAHVASLLFPAAGADTGYPMKQVWGSVHTMKEYATAVNRPDGQKLWTFCVEQFNMMKWYVMLGTDKLYDYRLRGKDWKPLGVITGGMAVSICCRPDARKQTQVRLPAQCGTYVRLDAAAVTQYTEEQIQREVRRQTCAEATELNCAMDLRGGQDSSPEPEITEIRLPRVPQV
jgi:hypothetical protein